MRPNIAPLQRNTQIHHLLWRMSVRLDRAGRSAVGLQAPARPCLVCVCMCTAITSTSSPRRVRSICCTSAWCSRRCCTTSCTLRPRSANSAAPPSASSVTLSPSAASLSTLARSSATPKSCTDVHRFLGHATPTAAACLSYASPRLRHCSSAHGPLQPLCRVHVRPSRAAEFRRAQSGAEVGAGAARVRPAPRQPTRLLTDASKLAVSAILEQPDDAGTFQPVAFHPDRALVLAPPSRVAGGGARAQGSVVLPPRQALRATHRQCQATVAATIAPRQSSSGALAQPAEYQYRVTSQAVPMRPTSTRSSEIPNCSGCAAGTTY